MTLSQQTGESMALVLDRTIYITQSAKVLDAMANTNRLQVLSHLVGQEVSVGRLSERMGLSQSALSQHLAKMRSAGLVQTRREAQTIFYSCNSIVAIQLLALLSEVSPLQHSAQAAEPRQI